ncbi:site-specific integrase [Streptomyces sp. NBC_01304]|uniref:site-specific integrase n=1 Tax=Streptomyces sp. NBC_01304 TaxID=2903818 RepID=UPI002E0F40E0|nr:site-specific integrase [Streptomyces sp. NBC_01304]
MTAEYARALPALAEDLRPETPVLLNRPVRPGTDTAILSVLAEDRWELTPALFEEHISATSLNFSAIREPLRRTAKTYVWQLLNCLDSPALRRFSNTRLSVRTVVSGFPSLTSFLVWLDVHGISALAGVSHADLDAYLTDLRESGLSRDTLGERIIAVRRLWAWREVLPPGDRLPESPPWQGADANELIGRKRRGGENRTPRIPSANIDRLLLWSLRFVHDFADDILVARDEYVALVPRSFTARHRHGGHQDPRTPDAFHTDLDSLLRRMTREGTALPGKPGPDGQPVLDRQHLARILNCPTHWLNRNANKTALAVSGLPLADAAYLRAPIQGQFDGRPWRPRPITFTEAPHLIRHLATACAIIVTYLSGARPGEVLSLRRGCIRHDPAADLWLMTGRKWKGAVDASGQKKPEGEERTDPWVVVRQVADAVSVLEQLHDRDLLFPTTLFDTRLTDWFTAWIDDYCTLTGRDERVPPDPSGRQYYPVRFRRTLAWHIVRKPRGLVAGAIQYGHLHVGVTLGYSGTYASGFPDEHAFETWLLRLEQLADAETRLRAGEHVSGPAAPAYNQRVHQVSRQFAGRVLTSTRQARDLLDNPALQIHEGKGMTCVFDPAKAKCRLGGTESSRRTPDLTDCQPGCQNIARTDRDITVLQGQIVELEDLVDDPLSPAPRQERERHELARLITLVADHDRTRPDTQ